MIKYKDRYRISSSRAPWWNYAAKGIYFITICTAERRCLLGKVQNNKMILSEIGAIVLQEWETSFEIRKELVCDAFVIMPNHIHAIVSIGRDASDALLEMQRYAFLQQSESVENAKGVAYRPPKSISSFVAGFKASATKRTTEYPKADEVSIWQPRFHDRIIRDEDEYMYIKQYIETNIDSWEKDELYGA